MLNLAISSVLAATAVSYVSAQSFVSDPLVDKVVPYTAIPYQVDTHTDGRGPQSGYNLCNSTTEGQQSECQTSFMNHLDDFCLFAPASPNSTIGDTEGEEVAWCTQPGRGTRLIPAGALQGVQLVQSPGYIQIVGFIDQTLLNIQDGDFGGELDSGGQDGRGNPIGGLVYSNAFPSNGGNNNSFQQSRHWTYFIGGGTFCAKACDDTQPNAEALCQHIYDRIGCAYNAPSNAQKGTFESCQGADMSPVGIYTSNGATITWTQPPESLGAITSIPYTPTPAPSSNCVQFQSQELYSQLASVSGGVTTTGSGASRPTGSAGASGSGSGSGSRAAGSGTATATGAGATNSNAAGTAMGVSVVSGIAGVLFSAMFFA